MVGVVVVRSVVGRSEAGDTWEPGHSLDQSGGSLIGKLHLITVATMIYEQEGSSDVDFDAVEISLYLGWTYGPRRLE